MQRRNPRQQIEILKNKADFFIAGQGQLIVVQRGDFRAIQLIRAGSRPIQASENIHQRRFSRSGRSRDRHKLALPDEQAHAIQRMHRRVSHLINLH